MYSKIFFLVFCFFFITSCTNTQSIVDEFEQGKNRIQEQYVPDLSLNVFSVQLEQKENIWTLSGETTLPEAKKMLIEFADSLFSRENYQNQIQILPQAGLGDSIFALVKHAVVQIRRYPENSSELIDQAILGNVLKLLQKEKSWYRVQTHYGYIGWVKRYSLKRVDEQSVNNWKKGALQRVTKLMDFVYEQASEKSDILSSVVLNSTLLLSRKGPKWSKVILPDGKEGFIGSSNIVPWKKTLSQKITSDAVIQTAKSMMGLPYLWGGNSSLTNDCSGFTQTVFLANGMQLPRDARQQVLQGREIIPEQDFSNVKPGDLLFFGFKDRITHAAISLGGYDFIHQDSDAHIDSFDENSPQFNKNRKKSLKRIKRFIN